MRQIDLNSLVLVLQLHKVASKKIYSVDTRSPKPLNEVVSRTMSKIRSKNTKPELLIRSALWSEGIRGYRLHWKKAPGKPDLAFPSKKIAIFIHGCYWHRCPHCQLAIPKNNADFWKQKFENNQNRDLRNQAALHAEKWRTLVLWECKIKKDIDECLHQVRLLLSKE